MILMFCFLLFLTYHYANILLYYFVVYFILTILTECIFKAFKQSPLLYLFFKFAYIYKQIIVSGKTIIFTIKFFRANKIIELFILNVWVYFKITNIFSSFAKNVFGYEPVIIMYFSECHFCVHAHYVPA